MSAEQNKAVLRRFFAEVVNKGNFAVAEELFPTEVAKRAKQTAAMWRTAFPDLAHR